MQTAGEGGIPDFDSSQHGCPVDSQQLGNSTWTFLHTMAAYVPDQPSWQERRDLSNFMSTLSRFYPCPPCAQEMRAQSVISLLYYLVCMQSP